MTDEIKIGSVWRHYRRMRDPRLSRPADLLVCYPSYRRPPLLVVRAVGAGTRVAAGSRQTIHPDFLRANFAQLEVAS